MMADAFMEVSMLVVRMLATYFVSMATLVGSRVGSLVVMFAFMMTWMVFSMMMSVLVAFVMFLFRETVMRLHRLAGLTR